MHVTYTSWVSYLPWYRRRYYAGVEFEGILIKSPMCWTRRGAERRLKRFKVGFIDRWQDGDSENFGAPLDSS